MKNILLALTLAAAAAPRLFAADPALTIYNQNFAVVRDTIPLNLQAGVNSIRYAGATALVEPDSVILRDPAGAHSLQILEQDYRNDPVSEPLLLSLFEGRTIDFQNIRTVANTQQPQIIHGKIIRSGYVPNGGGEQPIIEVNGKLQFSLPGQPLFPDLGDDTILKPTMNWVLQSDKPGKFDAEVGYITGGFSWESAYNLVSPEKGDNVDLVGWLTLKNDSGKTFTNAKIKLLAGDVSKFQPPVRRMVYAMGGGFGGGGGFVPPPAVTEKAFDEFHLYDVARPATLHDRETKQVEFVHAENIYAPTIYVYDGGTASFSGVLNTQGYGEGGIDPATGLPANRPPEYRPSGNHKVVVMREFVNSETNHLGIALPRGRLRFYRRDSDGQLQFVGENEIDHTPREETVRVTTGNSFDLVGEHKPTDFKIDLNALWMDESFEIKLRNRKKEPVEIRVVEHLYRWSNWTIAEKSDPFVKTDAQTIEFRAQVQPDVEKTITYKVHYSW